jgi:iron complex outermembrane receptor protein
MKTSLRILLAGGFVLAPVVQLYAQARTGENASALETVVVTAQRREERLQDVPLTVTVVTSAQLDRQNIAKTSDLVKSVPALNITNYGTIQVRGIGTQGFGISAEGAVSTVLDGVVLGRNGTNSMFDLERVEVLSGPQGTLFGKNSSAGVLNVVTKAPKFNEYEFIGHVDGGNQDYVHGYAIGNVPIGENAALRVAYHHDAFGGTVYNRFFNKWDKSSDDGVRARLLWQPTDRLALNLIGDYDVTRANGVNGTTFDFAGVAEFLRVNPGSQLAQVLADCGIRTGPQNNSSCANSTFVPGFGDDVYGDKAGGASLQIDYDLGSGFNFTSITAYRERKAGRFGVDADMAGVSSDSLPSNVFDRNLVPSSSHTVSQEARIESPSDKPLTFQGGIYASRTQSHNVTDQAGQLGIALPAFLEVRRLSTVDNDLQTYAGFGQANYKLTSDFEMFLGARYTYDVVEDLAVITTPDAFNGVTGRYIYVPTFTFAPVNQLIVNGSGSSDEAARITKSGVSWKLGGIYRATPDATVFATITRGYKGPYINDQASPPIEPGQLLVKAEYPMAYELGLKSTLASNFVFNITAFYTRIKDFQTTVFTPGTFVNNFIQGNAPHVITQGVEISTFGRLFPGFTFNAGLIYNESNFGKDFSVACFDPTTYTNGRCDAVRQLPYAPKWKGTVSGEYSVDLSDRMSGFAQLDFVYASSYPYLSDPLNEYESPEKKQVGARLGIRSSDDKWGAALFCRNCFDQRYPVTLARDGLAGADGGRVVGLPDPTYQYFNLDSYRVVGVTLDVKL